MVCRVATLKPIPLSPLIPSPEFPFFFVLSLHFMVGTLTRLRVSRSAHLIPHSLSHPNCSLLHALSLSLSRSWTTSKHDRCHLVITTLHALEEDDQKVPK